MSFGTNLQFLRKMRNHMTQEELADQLDVSRQTVSKWELNSGYPEMNKMIELCKIFSCSMDEIIMGDMSINDEAYSDIRIEEVGEFRYICYAVLSMEPEDDAINHVRGFAESLGISSPEIIGWDFPFLSQEQVNVFHMHGYAAALILPPELKVETEGVKIITQKKQKYITITINPYTESPFIVIPNAYKVLQTHIQVNGLKHLNDKNIISCFEKEYIKDGLPYMDVYIAIE